MRAGPPNFSYNYPYKDTQFPQKATRVICYHNQYTYYNFHAKPRDLPLPGFNVEFWFLGGTPPLRPGGQPEGSCCARAMCWAASIVAAIDGGVVANHTRMVNHRRKLPGRATPQPASQLKDPRPIPDPDALSRMTIAAATSRSRERPHAQAVCHLGEAFLGNDPTAGACLRGVPRVDLDQCRTRLRRALGALRGFQGAEVAPDALPALLGLPWGFLGASGAV